MVDGVPTTWERVQIARHPGRPRTLDFLAQLCDDFIELHGDRQFHDDRAMVGGLATFRGRSIVVIGHQKGSDTRENLERNFGMARPEGYRKALRLMRHAAKFDLPLVTFVDTPGADPGTSSEEHGQPFAIAECIYLLAELPVPVVTLVVGEGGSGGALGIGLADRILMLENAIYSVASPEASASILWKDSGQAPAAAEAMRITAAELHDLGIIDEVIPEPIPAHEAPAPTITAAGDAITRHLDTLTATVHSGETGTQDMLDARLAKYRNIGDWQEIPGA